MANSYRCPKGLHRYIRHEVKGIGRVLQCNDCTHYLTPISLGFSRRARCWKCRTEYIIDAYNLSKARLICSGCQSHGGIAPSTIDPDVLKALNELKGIATSQDTIKELKDDDEVYEGEEKV